MEGTTPLGMANTSLPQVKMLTQHIGLSAITDGYWLIVCKGTFIWTWETPQTTGTILYTGMPPNTFVVVIYENALTGTATVALGEYSLEAFLCAYFYDSQRIGGFQGHIPGPNFINYHPSLANMDLGLGMTGTIPAEANGIRVYRWGVQTATFSGSFPLTNEKLALLRGSGNLFTGTLVGHLSITSEIFDVGANLYNGPLPNATQCHRSKVFGVSLQFFTKLSGFSPKAQNLVVAAGENEIEQCPRSFFFTQGFVRVDLGINKLTDILDFGTFMFDAFQVPIPYLCPSHKTPPLTWYKTKSIDWSSNPLGTTTEPQDGHTLWSSFRNGPELKQLSLNNLGVVKGAYNTYYNSKWWPHYGEYWEKEVQVISSGAGKIWCDAFLGVGGFPTLKSFSSVENRFQWYGVAALPPDMAEMFIDSNNFTGFPGADSATSFLSTRHEYCLVSERTAGGKTCITGEMITKAPNKFFSTVRSSLVSLTAKKNPLLKLMVLSPLPGECPYPDRYVLEASQRNWVDKTPPYHQYECTLACPEELSTLEFDAETAAPANMCRCGTGHGGRGIVCLGCEKGRH